MTDTMIGVDLTGHVKFRQKLTREQFRRFMSDQPACVVVSKACGSASYWAREMEKLGHEARLIAPQYVRPFVKRQKNDAANAEAIVIAAPRPEMRFVEPKTEAQQARTVLFRARERLVHQRTELVNALRGILYEFGHIVPQGIGQIKRIEAILDAEHSDLPVLVREECRDLLAQIAEKTERIDARTRTAKELAARRLQTMPGVGPLTALAIEAFAPDMSSFRNGRDFAAWLGLVRASTPRAVGSSWEGFRRPATPTFAARALARCRASRKAVLDHVHPNLPRRHRAFAEHVARKMTGRSVFSDAFVANLETLAELAEAESNGHGGRRGLRPRPRMHVQRHVDREPPDSRGRGARPRPGGRGKGNSDRQAIAQESLPGLVNQLADIAMVHAWTQESRSITDETVSLVFPEGLSLGSAQADSEIAQ